MTVQGAAAVTGGLSDERGTTWYRIDGVERMEPFLMTVVSDNDLWMFVSSNGPLTAGRVDANGAFLPYETDDRLHRAAGITGPVEVVALRGSVDLAIVVSAPNPAWRHDPDVSGLDAHEAYVTVAADVTSVELLSGPGTAR